ncbi:phospho-N-acetylmuramoyl-pentapeptide-transferase [Campylobacter curvus]|uniref:phospho-N-acetylmuramoyl-pentapeptide- transferase n=1 Tax=Campylobacter curvus TaxID=200 RepID=UPI00147064AF|nr:phospho-N-acetylmuramoyl-pentapeptide-transferase [Campylobacter curvus]
MFYYIYELLNFNIFQYITVRAGFSFFITFCLTVYLMPKFIAWAKAKNAAQPIYELAPQTHQKKAKTPTMGGLVFIGAAVFATLLCARLDNIFVVASLLCLVGFSALGFKDDLNKILGGKNHDGLSPRAKLAVQVLIALTVSSLLYFHGELGSKFYLPFYKFALLDLGVFAIFFWTIVIVAASNAVNLTDGLDGLASVPAIFSLLTLGVFAYICGHAVFSTYLLLPKIVGVGETVIIAAALIGSLMGFLWFNCHPAEVFMGDSGSLSVGAYIGLMGVMTKNEILLIIIGFVFVMETLSVILQVGSFKIFKKRIFLMAPIHHHFEIKGWVENKIIVRFWLIAILANLIALTALKIR